MLKKKQKRLIFNLLTHIILIFMVVLVNLPNINMAGTAFKSKTEALKNLNLLPDKLSFESFRNVINNSIYMTNVLNSIIVGLVVTLLCITIAGLSGYAISRFKVKLLRGYSIMLLIFQMFPGILLLIPLFIIFNRLGLVDTRLSVILAYTAIFLPFSTWMLKGFFDTIPFEIEESAMIDGASYWGTFIRVILPLSLPGLTAVAIFAFVNCWNEFMLASIFLRDENIQTLTMGLQRFVQQFNTDWTALMAASTIALVPSILFLIFAQRYLIEGLTAGAVKG